MSKRKISGPGAVNVNPFKLDALEVERLRVQLAKRANQRLVRLEHRKASTGEYLSEFGAAQYAYNQIKQIRHVESTKSGKLRFRESPVKDVTSARRELFALQSFLNQETSKAGVAARYVSQTEETFKKAGISAAGYKSFYNFLNSTAFSNLAEYLTSDDIVELYNKAYEKGHMSHAEIQRLMSEYLAEQEKAGEAVDMKSLAQKLNVGAITGRGKNTEWNNYVQARNKEREKAAKAKAKKSKSKGKTAARKK